MTDPITRLDKLLHELASQQAEPDDFWRPEWASIREQLEAREFERRKGDRRRQVPKVYALPTH